MKKVIVEVQNENTSMAHAVAQQASRQKNGIIPGFVEEGQTHDESELDVKELFLKWHEHDVKLHDSIFIIVDVELNAS